MGAPRYRRPGRIPILAQGSKIGTPLWNPPVVAVAEVRDAIGAALVTSIQGGRRPRRRQQGRRRNEAHHGGDREVSTLGVLHCGIMMGSASTLSARSVSAMSVRSGAPVDPSGVAPPPPERRQALALTHRRGLSASHCRRGILGALMPIFPAGLALPRRPAALSRRPGEPPADA